MGVYESVSLGLRYKFEGGPVGTEIPNLGPMGLHMGPMGPQILNFLSHRAPGPHGIPNLEFYSPGLVVRDTVSYAPT